MYNFVICKICGKEFKSLEPHLFDEHNLLTAEYREIYADAELVSQETLDKRGNSISKSLLANLEFRKWSGDKHRVPGMLTKEELDVNMLKKLYVDDHLRITTVSKMMNTSYKSVICRLHELGLVRTKSEASKIAIRPPYTEKWREHNSEAKLKAWSDPNSKYNSEEFRLAKSEKSKETRKITLSDPDKRDEWIKAISAGREVCPNGPETVLIDEILGDRWKYVGNFKFWIGGYNPDFILADGHSKKLIEMFGCYWHCCSDCGFDDRSEQRNKNEKRIIAFINHGWEVLIIWEHELLYLDKLANKIRNFEGGNSES